MRVSVAMCTYNGARFVGEQLRSIREQTRAVDEIIVCDDGSTDGTLDLLGPLAQRNSQQFGVTKNFERAIGRCTGDVIFLADQDDVWDAEKVAVLTGRLGVAAMAFSNAAVVNEDLSPAGYRLWDSVWFDRDEQARVSRGEAVPVLLRHAIAAGTTLAFKAEYRPLLLPIPDLPHCHDIWITLLLACVARIEPVDRDLVRYRLHGANTVGLKRHGLLSQIRMARHQVSSGAFLHQAELCQAAHDRLVAFRERWPASEETLALLREKVAHSRIRHTLPGWPRRVGLVANEWRRGNYAKYSYGVKSVMQDLFLR